jgi:hypothetical protein
MNVPAFHERRAPETTRKALVVYDDYASVAGARLLLARAARHTGDHVTWVLNSWRFDMLSGGFEVNRALAAGADADAVLVAVSRVQPPPSWLMEWLERWAVARRRADATMAVTLAGRQVREPAPVPIAEALRRLAELHGLAFLYSDEQARMSRAAGCFES